MFFGNFSKINLALDPVRGIIVLVPCVILAKVILLSNGTGGFKTVLLISGAKGLVTYVPGASLSFPLYSNS